MVKRPTGPFWDASHDTKADDDKLQKLSDLNPARDRDNVGRAPKPPSLTPTGATNLAPRGALGYRKSEPVPKPFKSIVPKDTDKDRDR